LGREAKLDWNAVWNCVEELLHKRKSTWKKGERSLFRSVFTQKDPEAEPVAKSGRDNGYEPDPDLRDYENIPLKDDIVDYFEHEVQPHVPDAWMDRSKDAVAYEINFNRHFYRYTPPRPLEEIDASLKQAEDEILQLLREVTK
jgi:type I restriction enzyme M protein